MSTMSTYRTRQNTISVSISNRQVSGSATTVVTSEPSAVASALVLPGRTHLEPVRLVSASNTLKLVVEFRMSTSMATAVGFFDIVVSVGCTSIASDRTRATRMALSQTNPTHKQTTRFTKLTRFE